VIGGDDDAKYLSGRLALLEGRYQQALEDYRAQKYVAWRQLGVAMAEHSLGRPEKSQEALEAAMHEYGDALSYQYAMIYAWRNDKDAAFRALERAFQVHDGGLIYLKHDRMIDNLRSDPRFAALLKKLNLPQ
jgi:hypothetical protein